MIQKWLCIQDQTKTLLCWPGLLEREEETVPIPCQRLSAAEGAVLQSALQERFQDALLFDEIEFHRLHASKAEQVVQVIVCQEKTPMAMAIVGYRDGTWHLPYSAPFGLLYTAKPSDLTWMGHLVEALQELCGPGQRLTITLAPPFYSSDQPLLNALLLERDFSLRYAHLNQSLDLSLLDSPEKTADFIAQRPPSYRKNLKRAHQEQLYLESQKGLWPLAYQVIEENRRQRGYPLALRQSDLQAIAQSLPGKVFSFLLWHENQPAAAAIVFEVKSRIGQVVYWGSLEEKNHCRPMEYLALEIALFFVDRNWRHLDIGPCTAQERISPGLFRFKESIGTVQSLKPVLSYHKEIIDAPRI